jgi:hypothetical protein
MLVIIYVLRILALYTEIATALRRIIDFLSLAWHLDMNIGIYLFRIFLAF